MVTALFSTQRCSVPYGVLLSQQRTQGAARRETALGEGKYSKSAVSVLNPVHMCDVNMYNTTAEQTGAHTLHVTEYTIN